MARLEQASWTYWLIGVITAFMTSFYMFRLWFLTFFGEYRGDGGSPWRCAPGRQAHTRHGGHATGHGGDPREPAGDGGSAGDSGGALGGGRMGRRQHSLRFEITSTRLSLDPEVAAYGTLRTQPAATPPAQKPQPSKDRPELLFTGISVGAADPGFVLAWLLYYSVPSCRSRIAKAAGGLYTRSSTSIRSTNSTRRSSSSR